MIHNITTKRVIGALLLAALLLGAVLLPLSTMSAQAQGEPPAGTVAGIYTFEFFPSTPITQAGTIYSASPRRIRGLDMTHVQNWNSADVFVTVDVSGTAAITVTPQFSPDQSNWADAYYNTVSGTTVTVQPYQVVLSADGTDYLRLPIAGEYLRFKILTTGTLTPTIKTTLRNN